MTTYNKTTLKTFFENGDVPTGQNYADLIDSYINIVETGNQSMAGALTATELVAPQVSAAFGNFTTGLTAGFLISTGSVNAVHIQASSVDCTTVSAVTINCTNNMTASAARVIASAGQFLRGIYYGTGIVSATGTTQGAGALLNNVINVGAGITDGTNTGFLLRNNNVGMVQFLVNGGASANLWPASECRINVLATNAAFAMAANTLYTIVHTTNSAYAVR